MFTGQGLLQWSSRWTRLVSLSCNRSSLLLRVSGFCPTLLAQPNHQHFLKCVKAEIGCLATFSIGSFSRRCLPGFTAVKSTRRSLPFELDTRGHRMELPLETAEPALGFARQFWLVSQKEAHSALYHPFVVALASGALQMSTFQKYIAQDIYFLAAFAEAYEQAIENTDDQEANAVLKELKSHVQLELDQVHLSPATTQSSGSELMKAAQPNAATMAYTDFLLGVARGDAQLHNSSLFGVASQEETSLGEREIARRRKMAAYTIAAMTPCARLYAFLGQQIHETLKGDTGSNAYSEWITTYASTEFGSTAVQSENLVDRLAMPFPGEIDKDDMERLYRRAMELEVGFFAAQQPLLTNGPILVPLFLSEISSNSHFILVSDFDSTCTVADSCPALADLSISTLEEKIAAGGSADLSVQALRRRWDSLVDQYAQEYKQLLGRLLSAKEAGSGQSEERLYNPRTTRKLLEELGDFEITANVRVVNSGVLAGLNVADVKQAGRSIPLRDGCKPLLTRIAQDSLPLDFHVLSVCWSRSFIEGSFLDDGLQFTNIHSNELQFNDRGVSTGSILRRLQTPEDKENVMIDILNQTEKKLGLTKAFTVYVGDSLTDLLCLLKADIGIVIGQNSSLERVAEACGIRFLSLYSGLLKQQGRFARGEGQVGTWIKEGGVLYTISSWHELHAFLLGS